MGGLTPGRIVSALVWGQRSAAPPGVRAYLAAHGQDRVVGVTVVRAPISASINGLADFLTLGDWRHAKLAAGYRRVYHTLLALTVQSPDGSLRRVSIEKRPVVRLRPWSDQDSVGAEFRQLRMRERVTLAAFVERAARRCGARQFWDYQPTNANCQDFVICLLDAHRLLTPELLRFVKQPMHRVLANPLTHGVTSWATDLASRIDVLANGGCNANGIPCL